MAHRVERAEARARAMGRQVGLQYEHAPLDDLPHESNVFDAVIGEPVLSAAADPARAVAELVRVARPLAPVILLQLTWSSEISPEARQRVVARLGLRPLLLVEWKQLMRDAGAVELQVQDWTTGAEGSEDASGRPRSSSAGATRCRSWGRRSADRAGAPPAARWSASAPCSANCRASARSASHC